MLKTALTEKNEHFLLPFTSSSGSLPHWLSPLQQQIMMYSKQCARDAHGYGNSWSPLLRWRIDPYEVIIVSQLSISSPSPPTT